MALVSSVLIHKAELRSKLQAPGSPARRCGKEVPNGIRRVGDSRALRRGLSYLAHQLQSRREEKGPDVVQYEVEQTFPLYPVKKSSRSYSRTRLMSIPGGGRREVSRLHARKKLHEQIASSNPARKEALPPPERTLNVSPSQSVGRRPRHMFVGTRRGETLVLREK